MCVAVFSSVFVRPDSCACSLTDHYYPGSQEGYNQPEGIYAGQEQPPSPVEASSQGHNNALPVDSRLNAQAMLDRNNNGSTGSLIDDGHEYVLASLSNSVPSRPRLMACALSQLLSTSEGGESRELIVVATTRSSPLSV